MSPKKLTVAELKERLKDIDNNIEQLNKEARDLSTTLNAHYQMRAECEKQIQAASRVSATPRPPAGTRPSRKSQTRTGRMRDYRGAPEGTSRDDSIVAAKDVEAFKSSQKVHDYY